MKHRPDWAEFEKTMAWKMEIIQVPIIVPFGISTRWVRFSYFLFKPIIKANEPNKNISSISYETDTEFHSLLLWLL